MEVMRLLDLNRDGFTADMIRDVLHFMKGSRQVSFRFDLLNDSDEFQKDITHLVVAESSEVNMANEAEIHRTANFRIRDTGEINYLKERIQPWALLQMPDKRSVEFPLGVFLLSTPQQEYENNQKYRNIDAYDKLQILIDDGFTARYVADEGDNIVQEVINILNGAGITKINIDATEKILPTWLSWDPDVTRLEVVNELLGIINYEPIYVDEYGYFTSRPYRNPSQRSAEYEYMTDEWSVITPGAKANIDYFEVPNQWVGVVSEPDKVPLTYTHENTNEESPTSIPNRGRTITKYVDVDAVDLESLKGIVEKKAYKDSQVYTEMEFSTAIMPFHSYNDVYWLRHDKLGVNAKFQEVSWSMSFKLGGEMSHKAKQVISLTGGD